MKFPQTTIAAVVVTEAAVTASSNFGHYHSTKTSSVSDGKGHGLKSESTPVFLQNFLKNRRKKLVDNKIFMSSDDVQKGQDRSNNGGLLRNQHEGSGGPHGRQQHTMHQEDSNVLGVLGPGGLATYLHGSLKDGSYASSSIPFQEQGGRHLEEEEVEAGGKDYLFSPAIGNTNFSLDDFEYSELSYIDAAYMCDLYVEYDELYGSCSCDNSTGQVESLNCFFMASYFYESKCGVPVIDYTNVTITDSVEDYSNYNSTATFDFGEFNLPDQVTSTRFVRDNVVESCSKSINFVECQGCVVQPTLLPLYGNLCSLYYNCTDTDYESLYWCYLMDCTNTDFPYEFNDCFWSYGFEADRLYSTGCIDDCSICPGSITSPNVAVEVETFAANGSYTCGELNELAMSGYFTSDECTVLQSILPEACGCDLLTMMPTNNDTLNIPPPPSTDTEDPMPTAEPTTSAATPLLSVRKHGSWMIPAALLAAGYVYCVVLQL